MFIIAKAVVCAKINVSLMPVFYFFQMTVKRSGPDVIIYNMLIHGYYSLVAYGL